MKKAFLTLLIAFVAVVAVKAQKIAVVSESGTTTMFKTLKDAIEGASAGSTIYLPGGAFPISDEVKITKKITIIGIGHKAIGENADGNTTIAGNLCFGEGSSGSAVMGCYLSGIVNIGEENAIVNDVLIRYCNLNGISVNNSKCTGTVINQNYVRGDSNFGNSEVTISNNVIKKILNVAAGVISYNTCCHACGGNARYNSSWPALDNVNNSTIIHNIFWGAVVSYYSWFHRGDQCLLSNNYYVKSESGVSLGENQINIDAEQNDVFENVNGWAVTPNSNFHFKEAYKQYEKQVGIYGGTGFDDSALPPVPHIIAKNIPEQTDAQGKLNIKIRVKAGE